MIDQMPDLQDKVDDRRPQIGEAELGCCLDCMQADDPDDLELLWDDPLLACPDGPATLTECIAPQRSRVARTAVDAATRSFIDSLDRRRESLRTIGTGLAPVTRATPRKSRVSTRTLNVVHQEDDGTRYAVSFEFPATARDPRFWLVLYPTLELYSAPVEDPSDAPSGSEPTVLLPHFEPLLMDCFRTDPRFPLFALTYAVKRGYQAVSPAAQQAI